MTSVDRIQGLSGSIAVKTPCRVATTANITLSGEQTIDAVAVVDGDRVLVKNQTDTTENGIYNVSTGHWTRALDFDGANDFVQGTAIVIQQGAIYGDTMWKVTTTAPTVGGALAFDQLLPGDASAVEFTPAGTGAVATNVQAQLRKTVFASNYSTLQQAVDYVAGNGGGEVVLDQDTSLAATLNVTTGNVMLRGLGSDNSHDVGTLGAQAASTITWAGGAGGTMIKFSSPTGASAQKQNGGGVKGVYLDSNYNSNGAGIGIHLESWNSAEIKDVFCREFATACLKIDALAAGSLGDALDSQQNRVIGLTGRQLLAGGRFIWLDGNATASANASMNYFENCDVVVQGMAATQGAYDLGDCDNNVFMRCRAYAAAADDVVMFHASDDVGTARDNVFINFSTNSNGAIKCNGTAEGANASSNNKFIAPDVANGAANPVVGTGATVGWDKSGTFTPAITFGGLSVGVTYGTQLGTYTRLNDRVFYDIYVVLTAKGSSTGAVSITGLPFTAKNNGIYSAPTIRAGALEVTATTAIEGYVAPNTAYISLNKYAAGVAADLEDTDVNAVSSFVISGSYQVA